MKVIQLRHSGGGGPGKGNNELGLTTHCPSTIATAAEAVNAVAWVKLRRYTGTYTYYMSKSSSFLKDARMPNPTMRGTSRKLLERTPLLLQCAPDTSSTDIRASLLLSKFLGPPK